MVWKIIIFTLLITVGFVLFFFVIRDSTDSDEKPSLESLGMSASVAARAFLTARRDCSIIGIDDLDTCSRHDGPLPEDKASRVGAKLAIDLVRTYSNNCNKFYTHQSCSDLLNRAVDIAQKREKR